MRADRLPCDRPVTIRVDESERPDAARRSPPSALDNHTPDREDTSVMGLSEAMTSFALLRGDHCDLEACGRFYAGWPERLMLPVESVGARDAT